MTHRPFTRPEVEAEAGKKPWERQRTFSEELDVEHMADTAARYARAAAEARDADDLAEEATRTSAGAGGLDGRTLVDTDGRIDVTNRALQRGGDDIDRVVRHIVNGMNLAIEADKQVVADIGWLDWRYKTHLQTYATEYNAWNAALNSAAIARHAGPESARRVPLSVTFGGQSVTASVSHDAAGTPVYSLPESHYAALRTKHLKNAAGDATRAFGEIEDEILAYRHRMMTEAGELADLGYELGQGPFTLFATPAMARFAAGKLQEELRKGNPDTEVVEHFTRGLKSIMEGLYGDVAGRSPSAGDPGRDLSPAELAYLQTFFNTLDADTLARLGNLDKTDTAANNAQRNVANGISMLLNPEIGGHAPTAGGVPAAISHFVNYSYGEAVSVPGADNQHPKYGFQLFNGFGALIGEMTVTPHDELSTQLARSAVNIEKFAEQNNATMTGSSGMLTAAALNSEATATLLGNRNDPFYRELLSQRWDDDAGVSRYIESGTTPPQGMGWDDPRITPYVNAAYNVLDFSTQNGEAIRGLDHRPHLMLHKEIGDAALRYMDMLSWSGGPDAKGGAWPMGQSVNGTDYAHGFYFSQDQRDKLFSLMDAAPRDIRANFFGGVATWEYNTALDAFRRGKDVEEALGNIGTIAGTAELAQKNPSPHYEHDQRWEDRWTTAKYVFDAAGTVPVPGASMVAWPFKTMSELQAENLSGNVEQADSREDLKLQYGKVDATELLIAEAAVRAGYGDAETKADQRPGTPGDPYDPFNVRQYVNVVMGNDTYRFRESYNEALGLK